MTKHSIIIYKKPIKEVPRKLPEDMNAKVEKHVKEMLETKVIELSKRLWASRVVVV